MASSREALVLAGLVEDVWIDALETERRVVKRLFHCEPDESAEGKAMRLHD